MIVFNNESGAMSSAQLIKTWWAVSFVMRDGNSDLIAHITVHAATKSRAMVKVSKKYPRCVFMSVNKKIDAHTGVRGIKLHGAK